jgi:nicotianamine synthase
MITSGEPPVGVNGFHGTTTEAKPSSNGLRWAFDLPSHRDTAERITLGIVALFERLERLDTLEPVAENGRLFNQLFDLVTTSKTTSQDDNKVRHPFESPRVPGNGADKGQILSDPRVVDIIPRIWKLWGMAEYNLERGFARKVISGTSQSSC